MTNYPIKFNKTKLKLEVQKRNVVFFFLWCWNVILFWKQMIKVSERDWIEPFQNLSSCAYSYTQTYVWTCIGKLYCLFKDYSLWMEEPEEKKQVLLSGTTWWHTLPLLKDLEQGLINTKARLMNFRTWQEVFTCCIIVYIYFSSGFVRQVCMY